MQNPADKLDSLKTAMAGGLRIVPRETYLRVQADTRIALDIVDLCAATVAANPGLVQHALGDHPLAHLLADSVKCWREPIGRFDILLDHAGEAQFIEYNAGTCGGAFIPLYAAQRFLGTDAGRRIATELNLELTPTDELFARSLIEARPGPAPAGAPHLAVVLPTGLTLPGPMMEEVQGLIDCYEAQGGEARVVAFSDIEVLGSGMVAKGWPLHAALVLEWLALIAEGPSDHPLFIQEMVGETWIAGSLPTAVFRGGKYLFAVMSDPDLGAPLTTDQRRWVDDHIPRTRILPGPGAVGPKAQAILDWALSHQNELVLKPTLGHGGRGVIAGWTLSPDEWQAKLDEARLTPYVLQQRVTPRAEPEVAEGGFTDLGAFVWSNRSVRGLQSRTSPTWLLNMSGGGWPHPVAVSS